MAIYTNDKNHRITLRLNDVQFDFVRAGSDVLGISPSEFLRILINMAITARDNPEALERVVGSDADKEKN